ncbi:MAG: HDOD domain-containing protein [Planctomycetota bacterium]
MNVMKDLLLNLKMLKPMSPSIVRLAEVLSDTGTDLEEVISIIRFDGALTANILKIVNSAWSAPSGRIDTLREAVVRLGEARILMMIMGLKAKGYLTKSCEGYGLAEEELWRHSLLAALIAQHMNLFASVDVPSVAFTAALLHDIGKLFLSRYLLKKDVRERLCALISIEGMTHLEAERSVLATDHTVVGGMVCRRWNFPESLTRAIEGHHNPDATCDRIVDAVHLANIAAKATGIGLGREGMNLCASRDAAERLGITVEALESLVATGLSELAGIERMMNIDTETVSSVS